MPMHWSTVPTSTSAAVIALSTIQKEMHYGNVDLYLWIVPIESNEIICTQIGNTSEVCLVRESHPSVGDSLSVKEFSRCSCYRDASLHEHLKSITYLAGIGGAYFPFNVGFVLACRLLFTAERYPE